MCCAWALEPWNYYWERIILYRLSVRVLSWYLFVSPRTTISVCLCDYVCKFHSRNYLDLVLLKATALVYFIRDPKVKQNISEECERVTDNRNDGQFKIRLTRCYDSWSCSYNMDCLAYEHNHRWFSTIANGSYLATVTETTRDKDRDPGGVIGRRGRLMIWQYCRLISVGATFLCSPSDQ